MGVSWTLRIRGVILQGMALSGHGTTVLSHVSTAVSDLGEKNNCTRIRGTAHLEQRDLPLHPPVEPPHQRSHSSWWKEQVLPRM